MTDPGPAPGPGPVTGPGPMTGTGRSDTLGLRLALAFLGVALGAVALLAGLTAAFSAADVSALASRQRANVTSAIAVAAGAAWDRNDSWSAADLSPVLELATRTGAAVTIRDQSGRIVIASDHVPAATGPQSRAPITARGRAAGRSRGPAGRGGRAHPGRADLPAG
jgi:hypothetical protein